MNSTELKNLLESKNITYVYDCNRGALVKYLESNANNYFGSDNILTGIVSKKELKDTIALYDMIYYIDKSGNIIYSNKIYGKSYSTFGGGFCVVSVSDKEYGIINTKGDFITSMTFDMFNKHGTMRTSTKFIRDRCAKVLKDGKYALINTEGNILGKGFIYDDIVIRVGRSRSKDIYPVSIGDKHGFINSDGDELASGIVYDKVYSIINGLGALKMKDKICIVNKEGNIITPFKYDRVYRPNSGYIPVGLNDKIVYIDEHGNEHETIELDIK